MTTFKNNNTENGGPITTVGPAYNTSSDPRMTLNVGEGTYCDNAHKLMKAQERIKELERERNDFKEMLANIMECSTRECMCGGSINVTCGHGGCTSTADYHAIPHAKALLAKRDLDQQAKGVEDFGKGFKSSTLKNKAHNRAVDLRKKAREL